MLHRLPFKMADFLEQEEFFHLLERMSFPFIERYLAGKVTLGLE